MKDYVELRTGNGLDPSMMGYSLQMCGVANSPSRRKNINTSLRNQK